MHIRDVTNYKAGKFLAPIERMFPTKDLQIYLGILLNNLCLMSNLKQS